MSGAVSVFLAIALAYLVYQRAVARRAAQAVETDTHSLNWLTDCDLRPLPGSGDPAPAPGEWQLAAVGDLTAAEDLLDRLEAAGFAERELTVAGPARFIVRWR